jgi:hypothetical protein
MAKAKNKPTKSRRPKADPIKEMKDLTSKGWIDGQFYTPKRIVDSTTYKPSVSEGKRMQRTFPLFARMGQD